MSVRDFVVIKWMIEHWKPASALVYTVICLFDFVIFPAWNGIHRLEIVEFVRITNTLEPDLRRALLDIAYRVYTPYTMTGAGLFHLSFGALLTGVAVTSGKNIIVDRRKQRLEDGEIPSDNQE